VSIHKERKAMKSLLIVSLLVIVFGVGTAHAQPYLYEAAPCGTKDFTTAADVVPGGTICLDIYLTGVGVGNRQNAGGVDLYFSESVADIAYVSAGRCMLDSSEGCTGPWDPAAGVLINEPVGPGTVMYVVANLGGAAPDGDGDLIVGTVTLQNIGPNDATVNFGIYFQFSVWTPINNIDTVNGQIVISQVCYCTIDEDCDDGNFCNGVETCDAPNCMCEPATDPCPADTTCNEDTDTCNPILTEASVPTLSEWGMIIFMMIILGIGVVTLFRRRVV
jgi:hypothetical protein